MGCVLFLLAFLLAGGMTVFWAGRAVIKRLLR